VIEIAVAMSRRELSKAVGPKYGYLVRLRRRMELAHMTLDPLYKVVSQAEDAMQTLSVLLHYRSCEHGVGGSPATGGATSG
jgi:hypothetical protein